jgi:hypothetical protein
MYQDLGPLDAETEPDCPLKIVWGDFDCGGRYEWFPWNGFVVSAAWAARAVQPFR